MIGGISVQLFPTRAQLRRIRLFIPNSALLVPPQVKHHFTMPESRSFAFPGFLWKVDTVLDLKWLQDRHGRAWSLVQFYTSYFQQVKQDGKCLAEFIQPWAAFFKNGMEHPPAFDELKSIVAEISTSSLESWMPLYDRRALKIETFALHCSILLHLILSLREENEIGLADAVWNSVQRDTWPLDGPFEDDDVPSSVMDFPPTMPESLEIDALFSLEQDGRGGWLQSWIVSRIMTTGRLWYGNLVLKSEDTEWHKLSSEELEPHENGKDSCVSPEVPPGSTSRHNEAVIADASSESAQHTVQDEAANDEQESIETKEMRAIRYRGRHHRQIVTSILAGKVTKALVEETGHKSDRNIFSDDPGSYMLFSQLINTNPREEALQMRNRRAFFDLDEPSLVVTPFNTNMELLPRPETRAMSVSWVVRAKKNQRPHSDGEGRTNIVEAFHFVKAVRGMWSVGHHPTSRYLVSTT
jgi:hypothetical protein